MGHHMSYNLKVKDNPTKMGVFSSSVRVSIAAASQPTNAVYTLDTQSISTGMQATLSGGSVRLGDRIYHGFFYPLISADNEITIRFFINGVALSPQAYMIKPGAASASSTLSSTRSQPAFFSYSASDGDLLSIRYSKLGTSAGATIYEAAIGGDILFLLEVEK